ncbi:ATP synthase F(1) complex subunit delta, mitochondrial-like [Tubulanus polymorphus]|uniref:ATP synthase F(1) complex subunit delta, mitochondrial-like n=1 Tax=Tubulanus polymorphus TaxID=672921 RepID=UPI003DA5E433
MATMLRPAASRLGTAFKLSSRLFVAQQRTRNYADMAFTFASPSEVLYNKAAVKQVDVPSMSGSFGILPEHVPSLAVLKPGVVTVYEEDGSQNKYFVSSGSVTINDDSSVQVLAEEAVPVDQLDAQMIRDGMTKASQDLTSASTDVAKAEAEIAIECYDSLLKAMDTH